MKNLGLRLGRREKEGRGEGGKGERGKGGRGKGEGCADLFSKFDETAVVVLHSLLGCLLQVC